jgi:hypothetical protein
VVAGGEGKDRCGGEPTDRDTPRTDRDRAGDWNAAADQRRGGCCNGLCGDCGSDGQAAVTIPIPSGARVIEGSQDARLVVPSSVMNTNDSLPDDVETLQRLLLASNAELAQARAEASSAEALIAHLRLTIEKLRRDIFGPRNERKARLLDQMELQLEELEAAAAEDELEAEKAAAASGDATSVRAFTRKRPARKPFPAHLPREHVIVPGPTACACCGSKKRIDAIFDVEREINGRSIDERLAVRRERVAPLVTELEAWMRAQRAKLSRHGDVAKATDYMLKRWVTFTRFLADGRICLTNNAAEQVVAVRWLRSRRRACRRDVHVDPDRPAQRRRPAGLACRRARPHQRSQHPEARSALPWNWKNDRVKNRGDSQRFVNERVWHRCRRRIPTPCVHE